MFAVFAARAMPISVPGHTKLANPIGATPKGRAKRWPNISFESERVSQAISDLEQRLGVQLFIRQKAKAVTLTEAGTRVLRDARRLLGEAEALQDSAITTQNEISGALTVGCYATLSPFVIPPVLDEFAGAYPALRVDVIEGSGDEVISALVEGRWSTGAGLTADQTVGLVVATGRAAELTVIDDPVYWGRPIEDERYMVVSPGPEQPWRPGHHREP